MTLTISCARCGTQNEPPRLFCVKCGAKLDLEGQAWRPSGSWGRRLLRIAQVLLLAAVALLLWPVRPQGATGGEAEARELNAKMKILASAAEHGAGAAQVVSEAEINGYMAEILKRNPDLSRSKGLSKLGLGEVNALLRPEGITVSVVALWGPVRLSYEVTGRPTFREGRFGFDVHRARWGHLPLAGPASHWMVQRVGVIFSGMERERNLLSHIHRIDLGRGAIRVATGP